MNNIIILDFISDNSHGWIKVNKNIFKKHNIDIKKISNYSYKDNKHYYLEEDNDATYFINELKNKNIKYKFNYIENNIYDKINKIQYSKIRLLDKINNN